MPTGRCPSFYPSHPQWSRAEWGCSVVLHHGSSWEVPTAGQERPLCPQLQACASGNRCSPLQEASLLEPLLYLFTLQTLYCFWEALGMRQSLPTASLSTA